MHLLIDYFKKENYNTIMKNKKRLLKKLIIFTFFPQNTFKNIFLINVVKILVFFFLGETVKTLVKFSVLN